MEKLIQQMEENKSDTIVYCFGRTITGKDGKNILMFFNADYDVSKLETLKSFKTVKLCPVNCDPGVYSYLKN